VNSDSSLYWAHATHGLDRLVEATMRGCRYLAIALAGWLTIILVANVLTRYVLSFSFAWVDETSSLLLVWLMWTIAPLGFHENFHIAVGVLAEYAPRPLRMAIGILINLGTAAFFSITLYFGVLSTISEFQIPLYSIPIARGWMTWVLPASSAVILLVCANNILAILRRGDIQTLPGGKAE
jgi:TRAP-type C4-dicarboxylate transport system permease small subunit